MHLNRRPVEPWPGAVMASLQAALKAAIQSCYQLEDAELAAEPLPDSDNRRVILLYESAEGGAGVLRRLIDDPQAIGEVATPAVIGFVGDGCHRVGRAQASSYRRWQKPIA